MKISDIITMSLSSLWRRKTRTFLTILGVIIGTTSIVLMMSLGIGFEQKFNKDIEAFGNMRIIEVHGSAMGGENGVKKNDDLVKQFKQISGVSEVLASYSTYVELASGKYRADTELIGVDFERLSTFYGEDLIGEGQLPEAGSKDILAPAMLEFYNPHSRNWDSKEVNLLSGRFQLFIEGMQYGEGNQKKPIRVSFSGIINPMKSNMWAAYVDKDTWLKWKEDDEKRYGENKKPIRRKDREYNNISVMCEDIDVVIEVNEQIKAMGFNTYAPVEYIQKDKKNLQVLQILLGGIGFVALFVAAIGITNTMIMSIYERTKEIGVMKVLGAALSDIMKMFLVEAGAIGFIGGVLAIALSYASSDLINKLVGQFLQGDAEAMPPMDKMGDMGQMAVEQFDLSIIPADLAVKAIIFATLVGLIAGVFPAYRATKLSALKAIKSE